MLVQPAEEFGTVECIRVDFYDQRIAYFAQDLLGCRADKSINRWLPDYADVTSGFGDQLIWEFVLVVRRAREIGGEYLAATFDCFAESVAGGVGFQSGGENLYDFVPGPRADFFVDSPVRQDLHPVFE